MIREPVYDGDLWRASGSIARSLELMGRGDGGIWHRDQKEVSESSKQSAGGSGSWGGAGGKISTLRKYGLVSPTAHLLGK